MPLQQLFIVATPVEDLSPLEGAPITKLVMNGAAVRDLSPLKSLPVLTDILLDIKSQDDVDLLRTLPKLKSINLNPVKKILDGWKPPVPKK